MNETGSISITKHKAQVKMDQRPKHKTTLNLPEEKVESIFEHIATQDHFLSITPVAQHWDQQLINETFCSWEASVNQKKQWTKQNGTIHIGKRLSPTPHQIYLVLISFVLNVLINKSC